MLPNLSSTRDWCLGTGLPLGHLIVATARKVSEIHLQVRQCNHIAKLSLLKRILPCVGERKSMSQNVVMKAIGSTATYF